MNASMKTNRILDNAISVYGIEFQVNIAMEELSELCQSINKYFNRYTISKDEIASEIADVELCIAQLKRMIGSTIISVLVDSADLDNITKSPSQDMATCGVAINLINSYFMEGECYLEDLVTALVEVCLICKRYRPIIGDELIDSFKTFKLLRLESRIAQATNNSKEL